MMDYYRARTEAAVKSLSAELEKPAPTSVEDIGDTETFDPWRLFPALYGSYSSEFDACALGVLTDMQNQTWHRTDLAADMFREMLCTGGFCDYGSSPRACFPKSEFRPLLPQLIERWKAYYLIQWSEPSPA